MKDYRHIVKLMNEIKANLLNNKYKNKEEIKNDFFKTLDLVWKNLKNSDRTDLTLMYKVNEFLIDEVCNIHTEENSKINEAVFKENISIQTAKENLENGRRGCHIYSFKEPKCHYYIIGDIHSDTISIERILEKTDFFHRVINKEKIKLIFLGDYVDRGKAHLKTLQCILTLKYLFPQNIYIQRGNHDGGSFEKGEIKLCVRMPEGEADKDWFLPYLYNLTKSNKTFPEAMIHKYLKLFDSLSNVSFICHENIILLLTHGGIPRPLKEEKNPFIYIKSISDLTNESIVDCLGATIVNNMMWSDPAVTEDDLREGRKRFRFTEDHFEAFRKHIGFDIFVRGHQAEVKGCKKFFKDRLITVFSSGKILDKHKNINHETAYSDIKPKILEVNKEGEVLVLDLNS